MANEAYLTHQGKRALTLRMLGQRTVPDWVAWGSGGGVAAPTDGGVSGEESEGRVQGNASATTTEVTEDTFQVIGTLVADGAKTINRVGLFDADTGGFLYLSGSHGAFELEADEGIQYTLKIQFKHEGQA